MEEIAKGNKTQKGGGCILLYSSCLCHGRHILVFPLHPKPCNLLALQQLHRSHSARPWSSRKTTARGCEHLGDIKASSPQRSPLPALAMASAPDSVTSVISALGAANAPHPNKARGSLCSSALIRDVYSILCPGPHTLQSTLGASLRDCTPGIWADQTH